MIYSSVEGRIRKEAIDDAPRRVTELARVLEEAEGREPLSRPRHVTHEIAYLERIAAACRNTTLRSSVRDLRDRVERLPQISDVPDAAGGELDLSLMAEENIGVSGAGGDKGSVIQIAKFLLPEVRGEALAAGDEVRATCVEGQLPARLGKFTSFALPGKAACVIREWTEDDEQLAAEQFRGAILQLNEEAVVLQEIAREVAKQIDSQGQAFEQIGQNVANANQNVHDGVSSLLGAKEAQAKARSSQVGAVVGGAFAVAGLASGAGVGVIVARGLLAGAVTYLASARVSEWEMGVLKKMQADLEASFGWRTPDTQDAVVLVAEGLKAQERFQELAACEWKFYKGFNEICHKMSGQQFAMFTQSKARSSGVLLSNCAFKTSFSVELTAFEAWSIADDLRVQGALDPGCCAWWTRPVEKRSSEDGLTSIRYAMYTKWGGKIAREFVSVCRSSGVQPSDDGKEQYVCAVTSLDPEVLATLKEQFVAPEDANHTTRGSIYVCGMSFTETSATKCQVVVIGDVDSKAHSVVGSFSDAEDSDVKSSTLDTAEFIKSHLLAEVERRRAEGGGECAGPAPAPGTSFRIQQAEPPPSD